MTAARAYAAEGTGIGEELSGVEVRRGENIVEAPRQARGYLTAIVNEGRPDEEVLCRNKPNLVTSGGRDAIHSAIYINTSASVAPFNYIALSANSATPAAANTSLAGEITSGGLARAQATTRAHTNGQPTSTLTEVFTATASHTGIRLSAIFNASSAGTMLHIAVLDNTRNLVNNDTLTITWTITMG